MIKTILVAASGGESDESAFETALAMARAFGAHLDFYHVWVTPDESAALEPHVDFAQGRALTDALERLQRDAEKRSRAAAQLFRAFCDRHRLPIVEPNEKVDGVSAAWLEEKGNALGGLAFQARHRDLVVIGQPGDGRGSRHDLAGQLLLSCGRPVVIAPQARVKETGVVVVGWKETPEAARSLTAAMPFLLRARRVILANVEDDGAVQNQALDDLARQLSRHGVVAAPRTIGADGRSVSEALLSAAKAVQADLLVVGAYGHSRIRELIFGGVTQSLLAGAALPVFLTH
jgi:nucleotide-binding universal stress UspA family protein